MTSKSDPDVTRHMLYSYVAGVVTGVALLGAISYYAKLLMEVFK